MRSEISKNHINNDIQLDLSSINDNNSQLNLNNISIVNLSDFVTNINNKSKLENNVSNTNNNDQ